MHNTDWHIVVIDALRHAGRVERITEMQGYDPDRATLLWHDLRAPLHQMLREQIGEVACIINMASDSHVDRSISDPVDFVQNNVALALNMLEYARSVLRLKRLFKCPPMRFTARPRRVIATKRASRLRRPILTPHRKRRKR